MIFSGSFVRLVCVLYLLLGCLTGNLFAQTSNKGTDFWVAYVGHRDALNSRLTLFLTSEFNTVVNIKVGNTAMPAINLVANSSQAVVIDPKVYNVYVGTNNVIETNKGIHVTSDKPIALYSHIGYSARSGSTLVFPTAALGKEYYAISYNQTSVGLEFKSQFTIIGIEDGTDIEITPTQRDISGSLIANQTFTKRLNKGEIYQFRSDNDVSGSYINSKDCKPIAVFSGSSFVAFCEPGNSTNGGTGDNLYQQLLPVSAWGKNFITAPFYNTQNGSSDIFRIQVAENNTTITVNGSTTTANGMALNNPYSKGSIVTFSGRTPNIISADKPISLAQFQVSQACNPSNSPTLSFPGDPEMTIINPIEQTLDDISVYSAVSTTLAPTAITKHYINIIIKTVDAPSLKIDGISFPASSFKTINSSYSYLTHDVTASSATNPSHRIIANGGFVAIAYGYGSPESYAYLAGSDLKNLNKYIEVESTGQQTVNRICQGDSYKLNLILPYATPSLTWSLGNVALPVISNPTPTPQVINGDTFYKYEYTIDPSVVTLTPGTNRFKATVVNPSPIICNATEDVFLDLTVVPPPVAQFSAGNVCFGDEIQFNNSSNLQGFAVKSWRWDFGDGSPTSSQMNPRHTYVAPGQYQVTLSVITESGCSEVTSNPVTVTIYKNPIADFSANNACAGKSVLIKDLSAAPDGNIISWVWDFGDGTQETRSTSGSFTHKYHQAGTFIIKLKTITNQGCFAEKSVSVEIFEVPKVDFSLPSACVTDVVVFENLSTIADNSQAGFSYQWNFGDPGSASNTSTLKNGTHKYSSAGLYQVTLKVTSSKGCDSSITKAFTVNASNPIAEFDLPGGTSVCSSRKAVFRNKSRVSGFGAVNKLIWYFDYSNNPSLKIIDTNPVENGLTEFDYPIHHSLSSKKYRVRLEAYSGTLCSAFFEMDIYIEGKPEVVLSPVSGKCIDDAPIQLQARELHGFVQASARFEGTGVSSLGVFNPLKAGSGIHKIKYFYFNSNNCADTAEIDIEVYPQPSVTLGEDVVILEGQSVKLHANVTGPTVTYQWSNALNLSQNNIPDPVASPTETTVYKLNVVTVNGCKAEDEIKVTVLKDLQIPGVFSPNGDGINDRWHIEYLSGYNGCTVSIFNRNGMKVFESRGYAEPWDGRFNGTELPTGTYYYVIDPKNGRKIRSGNIMILR